MHEIAVAIKSTGSDDLAPQSTASQKDIAEAINTATTENEKECRVSTSSSSPCLVHYFSISSSKII